ncbi:hypothetical protein [Stenotrophomonas maltophilia group sp. LNF259]
MLRRLQRGAQLLGCCLQLVCVLLRFVGGEVQAGSAHVCDDAFADVVSGDFHLRRSAVH